MKKHLLALWKKVVRAWYFRVVTPCDVYFRFPMMGVLDWLTVERPDPFKRKQPVLAGCEQLETRWLMSSGVTEYTVPTSSSTPWRITLGPDNLLWFTEKTGGKIAKMTTSGSFTEYSPGGGRTPYDITSGPDGNLWFTEAKNPPPTPWPRAPPPARSPSTTCRRAAAIRTASAPPSASTATCG